MRAPNCLLRIVASDDNLEICQVSFKVIRSKTHNFHTTHVKGISKREIIHFSASCYNRLILKIAPKIACGICRVLPPAGSLVIKAAESCKNGEEWGGERCPPIFAFRRPAAQLSHSKPEAFFYMLFR